MGAFTGQSWLRSRNPDREYSDTLANVYESVVAEMDRKHVVAKEESENPTRLLCKFPKKILLLSSSSNASRRHRRQDAIDTGPNIDAETAYFDHRPTMIAENKWPRTFRVAFEVRLIGELYGRFA